MPFFTSEVIFFASSEVLSFTNSNLSLSNKLSLIAPNILNALSQFSFRYKLKK